MPDNSKKILFVDTVHPALEERLVEFIYQDNQKQKERSRN